MKSAKFILSFSLLALLSSCIGFSTTNKKIAVKGVNLNEKSGPINGYDYYGSKSPRVPSQAPVMKKEKTSKSTVTPVKKPVIKK